MSKPPSLPKTNRTSEPIVEEPRAKPPLLPPHLQNLQTALPHYNPVNDSESTQNPDEDVESPSAEEPHSRTREEELRRQYHESQTYILSEEEVSDGPCACIARLFLCCCACGVSRVHRALFQHHQLMPFCSSSSCVAPLVSPFASVNEWTV